MRWAFSGNNNGHINDAMWCPYNLFNHYQDLRFAETGELVEYRSDMLKINNFPIREGFAVSMCGVEYGGTAYVHTPDPTLKYKLYGEDENVYICRYFSSLFLGEFESYSLNCAGIPSISSMNYVFTNIFNRNFTVSSKMIIRLFRLMMFRSIRLN